MNRDDNGATLVFWTDRLEMLVVADSKPGPRKHFTSTVASFLSSQANVTIFKFILPLDLCCLILEIN